MPSQSFLARFLSDRRKRINLEDIRLEPYISKGVYTETGAIRPMPKRYPFGILKVLLTAIPFLYLGVRAAEYASPVLEKLDMFGIFQHTDDDDD